MSEIIDCYMYEPDDSIARKAISKSLKATCPGSYEIRFQESPQFTISIVFSDAEEATMFRMKGWM